jgi:kumamolisin
MSRLSPPRQALLVLACAMLAIPMSAGVMLSESVKEVPLDAPATGPHRVRETLTASELAEPLRFVVSLRMRDLVDLEARISSSQLVPRAELEQTYLPLKADYDRVSAWLVAQGFALTLTDRNHTNLFARGSIAQASATFGVAFARVSTGDGEFSSAVTAPSIPAEFAAVVVGIEGLQPHIRMHVPRLQRDEASNVGGRITPSSVAAAYTVPGSLTGAGQTIAVIMAATPATTDLTAFWGSAGINDSLANYTLVTVLGGPTTASQTSAINEATLDAEWASGMAPGAQIRFYAVPELSLQDFIAACAQIIDDGSAKIVTYSAAGPENQVPGSGLTICSQTLAELAAAGITVFASSGDGGSNPNQDVTGPNGYSASNPLTVSYPASDPNVTGVGGTTMSVDSAWDDTGETAWSQIGSGTANPPATGGGVSGFFPRPSWQAGPGVPAGGTRCVPDISAMAATSPPVGYTGAYVVVGGAPNGLIGTSVASPIWAGITALIKQARATQGLSEIGLLGPGLYPLIGSNAFTDITSGTNGAYDAGPGYDLCTGIGTPNVANLITQSEAEVFFIPPPSVPINAGSGVTMSATSQLTSTYQWQLNGVNVPGATSATYSIPEAGADDNGNYDVVVTNSLGTFTYDIGPLTTISDARIINLSARADVQMGSNILIAGFVVAGTGQKSMLVRGVGPALAQFGVSGYLAAPDLTLFNSSGAALATNLAWGGGAPLAAAMADVGAFSLPANSLDTALLVSLPVGSYTAQVAGSGNSTGVALAELYDADTGTPTSRLINISARADVQTGPNILIAGFVVAAGPTGADETVMIRGVGPTLSAFGVSGVLPSPVLTLLDSQGSTIASNQGWSSGSSAGSSAVKAGVEPATTAIMAHVGAFTLTSGSADSAMTVTLPPGSYTAQVSGAAGASGVGLVEVYEVK